MNIEFFSMKKKIHGDKNNYWYNYCQLFVIIVGEILRQAISIKARRFSSKYFKKTFNYCLCWFC